MLPHPISATLTIPLAEGAPNKGRVRMLGTAKTVLAPTAFLRNRRRELEITDDVFDC